MWPEIETAKKERRRELVLSAEINERIKESNLDKNIFNLTDLNYLSITGTCLTDIPNEICQLLNLQNLILHSNKFKECNANILKLSKLKVLDLSNNSLKVLPEFDNNFPELFSLNLSNNELENFPTLTSNTKLAVLNLSNNKLKHFPSICDKKLANLSEVRIRGNKIEEIPANIHNLTSLRILDISENDIKNLPGELVDCHKLKEINLKSNPLKDKRLKKLIDQCRTKQILDYIKQHCPKTNIKEIPNQIEIEQPAEKCNSEEDVSYDYSVNVTPSSGNNSVTVINTVKTIREHILCCILSGLAFTPETYKKFIQLQNKLHEGVCEKRNAATIATHDLKKLGSGGLTYTTFAPTALKIQPLNSAVEVTGAQLVSRLQKEADNIRKEKKRNTYSGIHKYLNLIEGRPLYSCLLNNEGKVISFPPITNSDISKIGPDTTDIFLEVTSSVSLSTCKNVLNAVIKNTVHLLGDHLQIVPIKILDHEGHVKVTFPSKNDLKFDEEASIKVIYE